MVENNIKEIDLPDWWVNDLNPFDAVCEECGTTARFETRDNRSIGEMFQHRCYSCNTGLFPEFGSPTQFRVTNPSPDPDSHPASPAADLKMYSSDDSY